MMATLQLALRLSALDLAQLPVSTSKLYAGACLTYRWLRSILALTTTISYQHHRGSKLDKRRIHSRTTKGAQHSIITAEPDHADISTAPSHQTWSRYLEEHVKSKVFSSTHEGHVNSFLCKVCYSPGECWLLRPYYFLQGPKASRRTSKAIGMEANFRCRQGINNLDTES
jgi:hypothetical protein